jgi:hypothetical protein
MLRGIVLIVVDPHHNGNVFTLGRSRDNHLLCTRINVTMRLFGFREEPGRFDDNIDSQRLPWQRFGALLNGETLDAVPVHNKDIVLWNFGRTLRAVNVSLKLLPAWSRTSPDKQGCRQEPDRSPQPH